MDYSLFDVASDSWVPSTWLFVGVAVAYITIHWLSTRPLDPREPPIVTLMIPYLGAPLGMLLYGGRHMKDIGTRNRNLPIFTLPVPGSRLYIVTDPSMAAAVQRSSRLLSFTPIIPEVTERILGLDKATKAIASKNLDPGPGEEKGFLAEIQEFTYAWLGPGDYLNDLTLRAVGDLKSEVDSYCPSQLAGTSAGQCVDLLLEVQQLVTRSTAKYLY